MKKYFYLSGLVCGLIVSTYSYNYATNRIVIEQSFEKSAQTDSIALLPSPPEELDITISCTVTSNGVQITGHLQDSRSHRPIAGIAKRANGSIIHTTPQGWFGFTGTQWEWIFFEVEGYQTTGRRIEVSKSAYWIIRMNKY